MSNWPKDNMQSLIAFYGDPRDSGWQGKNLVKITPPFQMYYAGKPVKTITVHRKIKDAVVAAFNEIWEKCGKSQKEVDKTGASDWGGCFNIRVIAGSQRLSNHSFAAAVDLSPKTNGFNMKGTLSKIVVNAFKRQGALWGGDYKGRKDPMHFEFVSR